MADESKDEKTQNENKGDETATLKSQIEALSAKLAKLESTAEKKDPRQTELDLREKAAKDRQTSSDEAEERKKLEDAIQFALDINKYVEEHKTLLPSTVSDILKAAEKEKYDSKVHKAKALKSAIIGEFFAVTENTEVLTKNQKLQLDDYLKLTNTGREEKASLIYENIFEPALETMKKLKKAEEVAKAKNPSHSSTDGDPYLQRMADRAKKRYIGDKHVT